MRRETGDGSREERRVRQLARVAMLASLTVSLTACEWFTDFKRQPFVTTWEQDSVLKAVRGAPQGSVPRSGTAVSALQVSYNALPFQIDTIGTLAVNPNPVTEASLANGHKYYQINCAVCHGDKGDGMGPAMRYGIPPINLLMDMTKNRTDGYIYGMMRNGRGLMPPYNRIEESDRWDVVNYLRALQGSVSGVQFSTGPVALPGVTGDKLPGSTELGPNRWVQHVPPALIGTPGVTVQPAKSGEHE